MKKVLFYLCVACMAISFTSCEKEEPSSLDLSSIPTKGKLVGTVYYNSGFNKTKQEYNYFLPAENQTVYISVDLSSYTEEPDTEEPDYRRVKRSMPSSSSVKTFKVTTDASGKYSIDIPVVDGRSVYLYAYVNFDGIRYYENDLGLAQAENGVFSGENDTYLYPNGKIVMDIYANSFDSVELNPNEDIFE